MKHAPNGREENQTARDWDPRTHEQTARDWDPRTHEKNSQGLGPKNPREKSTANSRRTKVEIEMLSVKMRQTKYGDDAEAKKTLAEATQQCNCNRAQDPWRQHSSSPELLWRPRMRRLPRGASQMCGTLTKRTSRHDVRENSIRITKRTMKFTW